MGIRARQTGRWLALALLLSSCAGPVTPESLRPAKVSGAPRVVVVKSGTNPVFDVALEAFVGQTDFDVAVYSMVNDVDADALVRTLREQKPALIFALGTKATLLAKQEFSDIPVLFAMVVNYKRHALAGDNVMGIALETPPFAEFSQFKMVMPTLSRVLAFYVEKESAGLVEEAKGALQQLGVQLDAVPVQSADEVEASYAANGAAADAVWLLNDPVVMNQRTFDYLRGATLAKRQAFLSSLSDKFAEAGALMSVSVDFTSLGSQAAAMAKMVLEHGKQPSEIGVQPPIGASLALNLGVAKAIDLHVPEDVLPFINRVIEGAGISKATGR